ncbi:MAG: histidine kinase [Bacteroidetes bacterium]|nr:histidine kinase [Bacteroidota bacterium]
MIVMYIITMFISLLLFLPIDIITYGNSVMNNIDQYFLVNIPLLFVIIFFYTLGVFYFNNTFWSKKIFLRIIIESLYAIIVMNVLMFIVQNLLMTKVNPKEFILKIFEDKYFFTTLLESLFIILLMEIIFLYNKKIENELEKEKFKYDQLKTQLNPHFLFNSLNILLAMVYKREPKESADFIEKLSDVYRYILTNDNKSLVLVKEEIEFIDKYGEILKARFNDGFSLNFNLKEEDVKKKILLMSLQLLVENAVKHNITCNQTPLIINIFSENNSIVVSNTKNIRSKDVISTGIGLDNLNQRYKIVANKEIEIINEDNIFKVIIPLI